MIFRSPYDREFEREQEIEREAYQRGANNILNKIRAEIAEQASCNGFFNDGIERALTIIDKYTGVRE